MSVPVYVSLSIFLSLSVSFVSLSVCLSVYLSLSSSSLSSRQGIERRPATNAGKYNEYDDVAMVTITAIFQL